MEKLAHFDQISHIDQGPSASVEEGDPRLVYAARLCRRGKSLDRVKSSGLSGFFFHCQEDSISEDRWSLAPFIVTEASDGTFLARGALDLVLVNAEQDQRGRVLLRVGSDGSRP